MFRNLFVFGFIFTGILIPSINATTVTKESAPKW